MMIYPRATLVRESAVQNGHQTWYDNFQKRIAAEVPEVKGQIKNAMVFDILYEHFVNGVDKEELIEGYTPKGGDKSYVARILSTKQGVDTCRRPVIRNYFKQFLARVDLPNPFEKYVCQPKNRKKKPPGEGFGLIDYGTEASKNS